MAGKITYEEAYAKLKERGQEHLLRFYDGLMPSEQASLLAQIAEMDLSYLDHLSEIGKESPRGTFSPLKAMTVAESAVRRAELMETGLAAIRAGKLAAVLLAGGMGTRLGSDGPKGTFDIGVTRHIYIFQRIMERLAEASAAAGTPILLFIMTSEKNDAATRSFFEEHSFFEYPRDHVRFFRQEDAPAVDESGRILLESKSRAAVSPNGNGGWFKSLIKAGFGDLLTKEGVEYLNVFAVDNVLQNIADPVFFGAVLEGGYASGSKVIRKAGPDEKVGVMCREDGHPSVVEYYEMTDEMRNAEDGHGERLYNFGVILNYLFRVKDLLCVMDERMPLHFAHKKVPHIDGSGNPVSPEEPNAWKFEYFIFDILRSLDSCLPFEVVREKEFAPVKNRTGADSVDTARELLRKNGVAL